MANPDGSLKEGRRYFSLSQHVAHFVIGHAHDAGHHAVFRQMQPYNYG